ncbi:hypothetical protein KIN20_004377 [Parelaphostrongylus tenuis]|uniref:Uncharacterized protein n=1 Tax=Parelaphostrongylus tenuis TaxID=148309 RepID=A0AAD5MH79_PARTN|nr:hypothetical protein KIN20_004377 [Parelaphostrongylus tenuis]
MDETDAEDLNDVETESEDMREEEPGSEYGSDENLNLIWNLRLSSDEEMPVSSALVFSFEIHQLLSKKEEKY